MGGECPVGYRTPYPVSLRKLGKRDLVLGYQNRGHSTSSGERIQGRAEEVEKHRRGGTETQCRRGAWGLVLF